MATSTFELLSSLRVKRSISSAASRLLCCSRRMSSLTFAFASSSAFVRASAAAFSFSASMDSFSFLDFSFSLSSLSCMFCSSFSFSARIAGFISDRFLSSPFSVSISISKTVLSVCHVSSQITSSSSIFFFSSLMRLISSFNSRTLMSGISGFSMTFSATSSGAAKSSQTFEIPISDNLSFLQKKLSSSVIFSASFIILFAFLVEKHKLFSAQSSHSPCFNLDLMTFSLCPALAANSKPSLPNASI